MITNIEEFCRLYYATSFIPITYYQNQVLQVCSYPSDINFLNLPGYFNHRPHELNKNPYYFITRSYSYLGVVKITDSNDFIIIGPLFSTPVTHEVLKDFMNEYAISSEQQSTITQILNNIPLISFNQFLNNLSLIHFSVNGLIIETAEHFGITNLGRHQAISIQHSSQIYDAKEEQSYHNTYHFEQNYLDYTKNGKTEQLKAFLLNNGPTLKEGTTAPNALRQSKNIFIISTTLSTRSAITGGLDIEQAYHLSDIYINECEKMQSIDAISNLQFAMITDFTERVAKNKISPDMSPEIFECVQFVNRHTNESLRVDDIASHIGRSRSYISKKFKTELGFELGSFIMHCKLEEAKSLLTYSNKSLSEISNYLCFSSQAYFQNVFKKAYGITPKQYRSETKI